MTTVPRHEDQIRLDGPNVVAAAIGVADGTAIAIADGGGEVAQAVAVGAGLGAAATLVAGFRPHDSFTQVGARVVGPATAMAIEASIEFAQAAGGPTLGYIGALGKTILSGVSAVFSNRALTTDTRPGR